MKVNCYIPNTRCDKGKLLYTEYEMCLDSHGFNLRSIQPFGWMKGKWFSGEICSNSIPWLCRCWLLFVLQTNQIVANWCCLNRRSQSRYSFTLSNLFRRPWGNCLPAFAPHQMLRPDYDVSSVWKIQTQKMFSCSSHRANFDCPSLVYDFEDVTVLLSA